LTRPRPRLVFHPSVGLIAACALALAALACGDAEPPSVDAAPVGSPVMLAFVESRDVVDRIEATGEIVAKAHASIAAQVGGQITKLHAEEGDSVGEGALVIQIDPERRELEVKTAEAGLAEAKAALDESRRELLRIENLKRSSAVSQKALDAAETERALARSRVSAAEAGLGLARRALADSQVSAPFAGLVARRYVNAGEFVTAGQNLFDIVVLDPVEVEFHLAEVDSARAKLGDPVGVRVAPYPDAIFEGKVSVVAPTIDERTRTLRVKARIDNADRRLRPGLFARVDLGVAERKGVTMIPEEAILHRSDGAVVFRMVEGDRVERLKVRMANHEGGFVEVEGPLAVGDRIVVRGHTELIDGEVVSVRTADGRAAPETSSAAGDPSARVLGGGPQ